MMGWIQIVGAVGKEEIYKDTVNASGLTVVFFALGVDRLKKKDL